MKLKYLVHSLVSASLIASIPITSTAGHWRNKNDDKEKKVYLLHTGDLHGDTVSHPNARADATGKLEGGLARAATVIKKLKRKHKGKIIWGHTGDTIHGSAVATYTQGKALVDIWDALAPDLFATGNWEYVYGLYRYQQLFGAQGDISPVSEADQTKMFMKPDDPSGNQYQGFNADKAIQADQNGEKRRWRTIAANAYYNGLDLGPGVNGKTAGEHFTDPYYVQTVNGIKIGFIGCTTNRGPQVVSSNVTAGLSFTNCMGDVKFPQNKPVGWGKLDNPNHPHRVASKETSVTNPKTGAEMPQWGSTVGFHMVPEIVKYTEILRAPKGSDTQYTNSETGQKWKGEGVDLVVVMSEAGIPENLWNAERVVMPEGVRFPEIILSSDTHERTRLPVVATNPDGNKTVIIEEGEDGMQVALLELEFENGKLKEWEFERYDIDESIPEDSEIADLVADATAPFLSEAAGGDWKQGDTFLNPFNGYTLTVPVDYAMASTEIVLERNRFSFEEDPENLKMPADIEGTLHDVYADSFRALTGADVGEIRGFRYNNTVMPGSITVKDAYHSLTIGAMVARGTIPGSPESEDAAGDGGNCITDTSSPTYATDLKNHAKNDCHFLGWPRSLVQTFELNGNGTQQANIPKWSGGWFWGYSGVNLEVDVFKPNFNKYGKNTSSRVTNVRLVDPITGADRDVADPVITPHSRLPAEIKIASYYFDADFNRINRNQIVSGLTCPNKLVNRACADEKIMILVKTGIEYGAQMAWVTSTQFSKRKTDKVDGYSIFPLDVVESFGRYVAEGDIDIVDLRSGTAKTVTVQGLGGSIERAKFAKTFPRITLTNSLPDGRDEFGFGIIQPMRGATLNPTAGPVDLPADEGDF